MSKFRGVKEMKYRNYLKIMIIRFIKEDGQLRDRLYQIIPILTNSIQNLIKENSDPLQSC